MQRRPRRENPRHLAFVRERPCIICGIWPCDPAHIKFADARVLKPLSSNIGMKADDRFTVPLCRRHHDEQHATSERAWWHSYHIDPILMALALFSISGDGQEGDRLMTNCMVATQMLRTQP
jgi:hypothetical protein